MEREDRGRDIMGQLSSAQVEGEDWVLNFIPTTRSSAKAEPDTSTLSRDRLPHLNWIRPHKLLVVAWRIHGEIVGKHDGAALDDHQELIGIIVMNGVNLIGVGRGRYDPRSLRFLLEK